MPSYNLYLEFNRQFPDSGTQKLRNVSAWFSLCTNLENDIIWNITM